MVYPHESHSLSDSREESTDVPPSGIRGIDLREISDIHPTTLADLAQKGSRLEKCAASLENRLNEILQEREQKRSRRPSIYRVHKHFKVLDPESYEPKMVSIGPLHCGKNELKSMEKINLQYIGDIVPNFRGSIRDLFDGVLGCLTQARHEYSERIYMSEEEFAEMLVVDGCFIIAHFIHRLNPDAFKGSTHILKDSWDIKYLRSDLLLLENQIPLFVLDLLWKEIGKLVGWQVKNFDILTLALKFLRIEPSQRYGIRKESVRHLLHLQHLCQKPQQDHNLLPKSSYTQLAMIPIKKLSGLISASFYGFFYLLLFNDLSGNLSDTQKSKIPRRIPGAMELHQAGIKFKAKAIPEESKGVGELRVSFRDGTLEIPPILVSDSTSNKLRNFIAFEQCYRRVPFHYTDYCVFMDHLINTAEDVAILQRYGILESMLGSDSEVADMFNGLCKKVLWDHERNYLADIYKEVVKFCRVPQHRWRANLLHNYFHSPWTVLSLMAGIILVTFTVTQTVFTIYPRK